MIVSVYAALSGILLLALSSRVSTQRRAHGVNFGDGGNADLARAVRVQGNFVEYVPLSLLLILLVEMGGASTVTVHSLGIALIAGRVLHAYGLSRSEGVSLGRFVGTLLTWIVLAMASVILLLDTLPVG